MRTVKYPSFVKKSDKYPGAFAFADGRAQFNEQRFNILPLDVATDWAVKYQIQSALVLTFYDYDTIKWY